jgi:diguanylate cyclase (GGDEF)-like protein
MKRFTPELGILTPFLAALCILTGSALLHVQEMRRLEGALGEQERLRDVRTELQAARLALLEARTPDWAAAAPHLRALADLHASETLARNRLEALLRERAAPATVLDGLLEATAGAESRNGDELTRTRSALWQRMWLMIGLGGLAMAYSGGMLLRALRSRSRLDERLRFETTHDSVTSLPNRRFFIQWAERALAQARRERNQVALLYVDLDGFRRVNDEQGREVGDRLLRVAARRFRERVREADVIARVGSDEYVVLTPVSGEAGSVTPLADRLIGALSQPLLPQFGDRYPVGASIGIAVFPHDGVRADDLLQAAETAMRVAKAEGGNRFRFAAAAAGPVVT